MHARTRTSGRTRFQLLAAVVAAALILNGPLATGASAVDSAEPDPGASQPAEPTPEVTASESEPADAPEADAADADATENEAPAATTDAPASEAVQPTTDEPAESTPADADQAPMVDPVEDFDESSDDSTDEPAARQTAWTPRATTRRPLSPLRLTRHLCPTPSRTWSRVRTAATPPFRSRSTCPASRSIPGDSSATIYWPDFGTEDVYVVQFEQADGTWKTVETDVDPATLAFAEKSG